MGIKVHIACDGPHGAITRPSQEAAFDRASETFGDLLQALRDAGWSVAVDGNGAVTSVLCERCSTKATEVPAQ
jgi:hypothetical protein